MPLILGIDAAWTAARPSGVALLKVDGKDKRVLEAVPCYKALIDRAQKRANVSSKPSAGEADVVALLNAARVLGGSDVDIVAIDMPMSHAKIDGRRKADDAVSVAFGAFGASVHSPNATRPGALGERLQRAFEQGGFRLATTSARVDRSQSLLEIYPLAALVRLLGYRPRYKVSKISKYFDGHPKSERPRLLLAEWSSICTALRHEVVDLKFDVPTLGSFRYISELKPYEDTLDAIVSAWVGACFLEARAEPYGSEDAAIWIPMSEVLRDKVSC